MKFSLLPRLTLAVISLIPYIAKADHHESNQEPQKVAIFVSNRGGADLDSDIAAYRDLLIGEIADLGYSLISEDVVTSALTDLEQSGESNAVDQSLSDQSSALNLARNIGADYLLIGSIIGFHHETREVNAYNVNYTNHLYTLRGSYRFIDGATGGVITSGNVSPTRTFQQTNQNTTKSPNLIHDLLGKAAKEIAANLENKAATVKRHMAQEKAKDVGIEIEVELNDIEFPEIAINEEGKAIINKNNTLAVSALAVTVEVDGIVVGTTGTGKLNVALGLHRLRLSRSDLVPWERMVNINEGMTLNVTMQMNEKGREQWMQNTILLQDLKNEAVLTEAEAESIRGMAEMLRQSGYKVDIKVDTEEGIEITNNQSLMNADQ